jgi:hypothetical protein
MRAPQPLDHIDEKCIPPCKRGKGLRLRRARVAAYTLQCKDVLPEMIGQPDNGEGRARRHHPMIVASVARMRPSSCYGVPILYKVHAKEISTEICAQR